MLLDTPVVVCICRALGSANSSTIGGVVAARTAVGSGALRAGLGVTLWGAHACSRLRDRGACRGVAVWMLELFKISSLLMSP